MTFNYEELWAKEEALHKNFETPIGTVNLRKFLATTNHQVFAITNRVSNFRLESADFTIQPIDDKHGEIDSSIMVYMRPGNLDPAPSLRLVHYWSAGWLVGAPRFLDMLGPLHRQKYEHRLPPQLRGILGPRMDRRIRLRVQEFESGIPWQPHATPHRPYNLYHLNASIPIGFAYSDDNTSRIVIVARGLSDPEFRTTLDALVPLQNGDDSTITRLQEELRVAQEEHRRLVDEQYKLDDR